MAKNNADWDAVALGEIVTLHRGYDLPSAQRRDGSVPVVSSSGITGYHDMPKIQPPGVVTGRYGTLGDVFFIEEPFWPLNTALYVSDFHGNDARFIAYLLKCQAFGSRSGAAAVPGVNRNVLHRLPARRPPIATQRKIAAILSAYDDLIENNNRRIKILEEMAQRIYREWFIEFRYPGHPDGSRSGGGRSAVPEGWDVTRIGDVVDTVGGGTPSRTEPNYWEEGHIAWYTPSDLTASRSMFMHSSNTSITSLGLDRSSARLFPAGSVMMTSRATIGVVGIAATEACTNQGFITCIPNENLSTYHLYSWILEQRDLIDSVASGATFKEISRSEFRELAISVPPLSVERHFVETVRPVFELIDRLEVAGRIARHTRDLLLPRLIAGEIDVSDLDIAVPEAGT